MESNNNTSLRLCELKLLTVDRDGQRAFTNSLKKADEVLEEFLRRQSPSKLALARATSLLAQQHQQQQQQQHQQTQEGVEEAPTAPSSSLALLCTMHYSSNDKEDVANAITRFIKQRAVAVVGGGEEATPSAMKSSAASDDVEVLQIQAINSFATFRRNLMQQVIIDDDTSQAEEEEEAEYEEEGTIVE